MANEVKLTLKVDDNGSLAIVAKEAKGAAAGVDKLDKSSKNLNKTQGNTYRNMQGVAGTSSNLTKNFSKMQQGIGGGLVPAYAALAARIFAVTALFGVLQRSAAVTQLQEGLVAVGNAAGQNLPYVADRLKEISGLAVSTQQAMQATALATSAGFSTTQLEQLTKVAKGASLALGRDMGDALDRLVRGTAKLEPEILDELGIMVRLDDAVRDYAVGLQKSADSLTQFERRQAFLNATIEQGTKKFDDIANVVEVNPYDKLAATFDDLSKTIINFGNNALGPIVEYLSNAPGALIGILALMGKTITNELTPALGELSSRAVENAEALANHAESLRKETVKDYKKMSKSISAVEFAPDSLKNAAAAYKDGSRGIKEMQKDLTALKISETNRGLALDKYRNDSSKYSAEFVAQKELEEQKVKDLRLELERLIAVEQGRGGVPVVSAAATNAGVEANQEGIIAGAIGGMTGDIKNDFSKAKEGTKDLAKDVKKATGAFGKLAAAGRVAGGAVRLFGAAMGSLLGPLGFAITAVGLLWPLLSKLFEQTAQAKAIDEISESFESFTTIAIRLNKVVREEGVNSFNAYYAAMKAGSGVIAQIQSGIAKAIEASQSGLKENIDEAGEELGEAYTNLINKELALQAARERGAGNKTYKTLSAQIRGAKQSVAELEAQTKSLSEQTGEFNEESRKAAATVISMALGRLRATGMADFLGAEVTELEDLRKQLLSGAISIEEFNKRLEETDDRSAKFVAGVQAAAQNASNLSKEFLNLGDKPATAFSKIRDEAAGIANELAETGQQGEAGFKSVKGQEKQYKRIKQAIEGSKHSLKLQLALIDAEAEGRGRVATVYKVYSDLIRENEDRMVTADANSKKAAETAKQLSKFSRDNAFLKEQELKFEKISTTEKIAGLNAERENYDLAEKTPDVKLKIKNLDAEILSLEEKLKDTSEKTARVRISQVREAQKLADLSSKTLKFEKEMADAVLKVARSRAEMAGLSSGSEITAAEQVRIFKEGSEKRKKLEEKTFRQELTNINLQYALLDAQMALEKIKMENILAEADLSPAQEKLIRQTFDTAQAAVSGAEKAALKLAGAKVGLDIDDTTLAGLPRIKGSKIIDFSGFETTGMFSATDAEGAQLDRKKVEESRSNTLDDISRKIERNTTLGNAGLAIAAKQEKIEKQRQFINADIAAIRDSEMEPAEKIRQEALKQVELDKLRTEELSIQRESIDNIVGRIENMGGGGVSVMAAFVGEMSKLAQPGAAFSAEFVGSFSERISALAESFNPLFDQLRKLGPGGEVAAAIGQGMLAITESVTLALEAYNKKTDEIGKKLSTTTTDYDASFKDMNFEQKAQTVAAGLAVAAMGMSQVNSMLAASASRAIGAIDGQIKAEQKRDGKSRASLEKIKQLEKKKDAMARKEFERNKKMQMAQVAISTASAAIAAYAPPPAGSGPLLGGFLSAAIVALGAMQMAAIASTSYQGGGGSPSAGSGPARALSMGKRSNVVDVSQRASGGELSYLRGARGSGTNANDFTPAFYGSKKMRAAGGAVAGYTVGEQGPELFVPSVPGQIVPNDDVGSAQPINVNFNVQAIDSSSFNDALTVQRGNIISIIREAANGSGEGFLETVDVESLKMER